MRSFVRILLLLVIHGAAFSDVQAANISGRVTVSRAPDNSDVIIFIDKIPGKTFPPPSKPETLDQINLKFTPHVMAILVGTTVQFPNSDVVRHNVFSPGPTQKLTLGTYPVGTTRTQVFNKPGVVTLLCNIHAEMSSYIVVTETKYFAKSDKQGNYTISDVPPGRYTLKVWHEQAKAAPIEITVGNEDLKDIRFDLKR